MKPSILVDMATRAMQRAERRVLIDFLTKLKETSKDYEVLLNAQLGTGRVLHLVKVGQVKWIGSPIQWETREGLLELVDEVSGQTYWLRVTDAQFRVEWVALGFNLSYTLRGEEVIMLTGNVVE